MAGGFALRAARRPSISAPEQRLEIITPASGDNASLAISPDGLKVVFVANTDGRRELWLRSLGADSVQPLAGTENAVLPFSVPASGWTETAPRERSHSCGRPSVLATNTTFRPSGEIASEALSPLAGVVISRRCSGAEMDGRRAARRAKPPATAVDTASRPAVQASHG